MTRKMVLRLGIRYLVQIKLVPNSNQIILRTTMLQMKTKIMLTSIIKNEESWILLSR